MACSQQFKMLKALQEWEFVAIELNLFLDTHPDNAEALEDYNEAVAMVRQLMVQYEQKYGPLMAFGMTTSAYPWQWIKSPWPWEM